MQPSFCVFVSLLNMLYIAVFCWCFVVVVLFCFVVVVGGGGGGGGVLDMLHTAVVFLLKYAMHCVFVFFI